MPSLYFVPPRGSFIDLRTGQLTRDAVMFLRGLFDRVGGSDGPSTIDVSESLFEDAGTGETNALLFEASQALAQSPAYEPSQIESLTSEMNDLRERLAAIERELDALRQNPSM